MSLPSLFAHRMKSLCSMRNLLIIRSTTSTVAKKVLGKPQLIDRLNRCKSKDLEEFFNVEQRKIFFQLKKSSGGKFHSFEQIRSNPNLQINFEQFLSYLSEMKDKTANEHRIHLQPRLTSKNVLDIENVFTIDYNSSFVNYALVRLVNEQNRYEVEEWNSIELHFDRKFHFLRTFQKFNEILKEIPLKQSETILLEENHSRLSNLQLASYINRLQQIRCVLNTLIHSRVSFSSSSSTSNKEKIFQISSRDVSIHFGLFVGNEQSSSEFHLTNLIFQNDPTLIISDELKTKFYQISEGQREPMAQCLLRALAFLQLVQEKQKLLGQKSMSD